MLLLRDLAIVAALGLLVLAVPMLTMITVAVVSCFIVFGLLREYRAEQEKIKKADPSAKHKKDGS